MTADLLVRLMTRCLAGAPCTVGRAHVCAVTDQLVQIQMGDLILIGTLSNQRILLYEPTA